MNNILLDLGFLKITFYSLFIFIGIILAYVLIIIETKKYGYNVEFINNLIFWIIIFGIIGARLYYVLFNLEYYKANLSEIYQIWNGGLAIHGGIILSVMFIFFYCKKYGIKIQKIYDILVVGLILAQSIGRWGNFFNSEAHGGPTTRKALESLLIIPKFIINGMKINGIYYKPTFYYEFLWCLLGFIVLITVRKFYKYLKVGQLTSIYFMWYGFGRFFIEEMRTDSLMFGQFRVAQIVSITLFLIGIIIFFYKIWSSRFSDLYDEEYADEIKF